MAEIQCIQLPRPPSEIQGRKPTTPSLLLSPRQRINTLICVKHMRQRAPTTRARFEPAHAIRGAIEFAPIRPGRSFRRHGRRGCSGRDRGDRVLPRFAQFLARFFGLTLAVPHASIKSATGQ